MVSGAHFLLLACGGGHAPTFVQRMMHLWSS